MSTTYKRSVLGTLLTIILGLHNVTDLYHLLIYLATCFKDATSTDDIGMPLILTLPVGIFQVLALRSLCNSLTRASALHNPVEARQNKRWLFAYIFVRVLVLTVIFVILFIVLSTFSDAVANRRDSGPESFLLNMAIGLLPDILLWMTWNLGEGRTGMARHLLLFVAVQQNHFPV